MYYECQRNKQKITGGLKETFINYNVHCGQEGCCFSLAINARIIIPTSTLSAKSPTANYLQCFA